MKFPVAYYLILLYATIMFKPLIPIAIDTLSHTFAEASHIACVHAKYGSNHLEKEIANTGSAEGNNKHQNILTSEDQSAVHVPTGGCTCWLRLYGTDIDYPALKFYKLKVGFLLKNFPPPKFS